MSQQIRDIMTESPLCVQPDTVVTDIAGKMRDQDVGAVLVTDDGELLGVVTDRDLVTRFLADGGDPGTATAGSIASAADFTVAPDDEVSRAVDLMRDQAVRRLPVVENGRPVGIVSIGDLAIERDERSALADISAAPANK
ncbi:Hypoxic response protein 1 [Actinomadura rubteroloni]|uniref:Hypoxic response protein 1 n=1 Tax=Actinomadura rubteroloni TaxID=1926885 RepID=A0A2P4UFP6_9ACTN|nr:CBS domain-containing protein [Actinomadura rubteroloni]POM23855.1 Hypoxic response protein 1 [Actinomadura rubteroloni]